MPIRNGEGREATQCEGKQASLLLTYVAKYGDDPVWSDRLARLFLKEALYTLIELEKNK